MTPKSAPPPSQGERTRGKWGARGRPRVLLEMPMLLRRGELEREEKLGGPRDAALDDAGAARNEACGLLGGGVPKRQPPPRGECGGFSCRQPRGCSLGAPVGCLSVPRGDVARRGRSPELQVGKARRNLFCAEPHECVQGPDKGAELLTAAPRGARPCPSSVPAGHQGSFWHVPSPSRLHKAQEGTSPPPHVLSPVLGHVCVAQSISFDLCSILPPMERVQVK